VKSFHHRRLIVSLTGKCPEKINHNIGIIHYSFILQHDQERKRWQSLDVAVSAVDVVMEEAGQNYTGGRTMPKSSLHAALGNNVFDYEHRAAADQM
jgi:hypothetical protein